MKTKFFNFINSEMLLGIVLVCIISYSQDISKIIVSAIVWFCLQRIIDNHTANVILNSKKKCKNLKSINLKEKRNPAGIIIIINI